MNSVQLRLPNDFFKLIQIKEKDAQKGITHSLLEQLWEMITPTLVVAEYKNLWVRLDHNSPIYDLQLKAMRYVMPILIASAAGSQYNYLVTLTNAESSLPEIIKKLGFKHRYMSTYGGATWTCSVKRLQPGRDNWPTFRACKESISAVVFMKSLKGKTFVLLGKNKPNFSTLGGRPLGTITGYLNPGETSKDAVKRELHEETGLVLSEEMKTPLVGITNKKNYYPGADDRNEVRCIHIDLTTNSDFELKKTGSKKLGDASWTLIQKQKRQNVNSDENLDKTIEAADDLAKVYILPIEEALTKMKPGTSGLAKVTAAYQALLKGEYLSVIVINFNWKSDLGNYDDVDFIINHV